MPEPKWFPSDDVVAFANLTDAINQRGLGGYDEFYEWSQANRAEFWGFTARRLGFPLPASPDAVLASPTNPKHPAWFPGAMFNVAESCFLADPDNVAIRYQVRGTIDEMTYGEMRRMANRVANGLGALGIGEGDRVAIAMPMAIESVLAYLGIVLAGAVVVSIADSFAPEEIATRLRIAEQVDLVVTQDVIVRAGRSLPMFDKVVSAGAERAIVVETGADIALRPGDMTWSDFLAEDDVFKPVLRKPADHMNLLFSSGTTGDPKAIPWTQLSPLKVGSDAHYHQDVHASDVVAWPTNLGWMMGPWLMYASFINRATMALCDEVPTGAGFAKFVERAGVTVLGVVPSLVAAWRASGVAEQCDWSKIRLFSSTGEAANPSDMAYLMDLADNKPVIDYIGGTELSGGYMGCTVLQPCIPGHFSTPTLGGGIRILDEEGRPGDSGELYIEPPCVGLSQELLNRDHHEVYYEGTPDIGVVLRRHGDHIERVDGGYYRTQGRVDDAMNLGGIKVGSGEIERAVHGSPGLREAAAIAVEPPGGGPSKLVMYVVVDEGVDASQLLAAMQQGIRNQLNPLFKISDVVAVDLLPRTASAKVMRRSLRAEYMTRQQREGQRR